MPIFNELSFTQGCNLSMTMLLLRPVFNVSVEQSATTDSVLESYNV